MSIFDDSQPGPNAWGAHDRAYTAERFDANARDRQDEEDPALRRLRHVLSTIDGKLKEQVEGWVKKWNQVLRESMRNQTALRLSVGEDRASVPIRVTDGMPSPLRNLLAQRKDDELYLLLRMPLIIQARDGAGHVAETKVIPNGKLAWLSNECDGLLKSRDTFQRIINELGLGDLLDRVAGIHEDILGAYYFRIPEIRIHWMSVGFVSSVLGVDPEALTIVTLAHELAHAYTHKGQDIDGQRWDGGNAFALSDLSVVEGLAQFFTAQCCKDMGTRHPLAVSTYEILLNNQPAAYQIQTEWVNDHHGSSSEIVRFSMLECRTLAKVDHDSFTAALAENRARMLRIKAAKPIDAEQYDRVIRALLQSIEAQPEGQTRNDLCRSLQIDADTWWHMILDLMSMDFVRRRHDGSNVWYMPTRKTSE